MCRYHGWAYELDGQLRNAAHIFGLSGHTFDDMVASRGKDIRHYYATLGLPVDASDDEIKSKYRRLVVEYHPDKVVSKGMPEEFVELGAFMAHAHGYGQLVEMLGLGKEAQACQIEI